MKILVIGSGGREHALVWKLARSPHVTELWCLPGNAGIEAERLDRNSNPVRCAAVAADNLEGLLAFAREKQPGLTVVGPDNPLALGVVDLFQDHGFRIWGPNRAAARFESSKAFSQAFMDRHGIPTAKSGTFTDPSRALAFAVSLKGRCAVKADGLALGKGVLLTANVDEARKAIEDIMVGRAFGPAGEQVVIQELLEGVEISMHALCDGTTAKVFPSAQDHKRALDGDQGLNTGGMGAYSPVPMLSEGEFDAVARQVLDPWLKGCACEGIDFRGILYPGVMLTRGGPKVLEFNARFGDPEAQAYLTRLENDLVETLDASAQGTLGSLELRWRKETSVCVVMASEGYPGPVEKGRPIMGLDAAEQLAETKVFHAGTARVDGRVVTCGGRVLGVTAWGAGIAGARARAYEAVGQIRFDGARYRRDIGMKALK